MKKAVWVFLWFFNAYRIYIFVCVVNSVWVLLLFSWGFLFVRFSSAWVFLCVWGFVRLWYF